MTGILWINTNLKVILKFRLPTGGDRALPTLEEIVGAQEGGDEEAELHPIIYVCLVATEARRYWIPWKWIQALHESSMSLASKPWL